MSSSLAHSQEWFAETVRLRCERNARFCRVREAPLSRKNQFDAQISSYLLYMFAGEVAAVVGVENAGDATDVPVGIFLHLLWSPEQSEADDDATDVPVGIFLHPHVAHSH